MNKTQATLEGYIDSGEKMEIGENKIHYELIPEEIPSEWSLIKLKNLVKRKTSRIDPEDMVDQKYVSLKHMGEGEARILKCDTAEDVSSAKYNFKSGDILFGKLRPYFRKVAIPKFDGICSTDINVIRPTDKVDRNFLFYSLFREDFIDFATKTSTGTRMPRADWKKLDEMYIALPRKKIQEKIGNLLYELDEKIEVNNRLNQLLGDLAEAVFKEWFVDFGPYNDFKESELGDIPEMFKIYNLSEIGDFRNGINYSADEEGRKYDIVNARDVIHNRFIDRKELDSVTVPEKRANKYEIKEEDILISRSAVPGKPATIISENRDKIIFSGFIIRFRIKNYYLHNYALFQLNRLERILSSKSEGTTLKNITQKTLKNIVIPVPPKDELNKFNDFITNVKNKTKVLKDSSECLSKIRDTLLSKLMSGEIRVNDLEIK